VELLRVIRGGFEMISIMGRFFFYRTVKSLKDSEEVELKELSKVDDDEVVAVKSFDGFLFHE